jgi:D-glycero-alpha-D-manno-heptose-7-phosphate kinase
MNPVTTRLLPPTKTDMSLYYSRAPARIDFGGGGSDAPPFSSDFGGMVVNAAICKYVHAELSVDVSSPRIRIVSYEMGEDVILPSVNAIEEDGRLDLVKLIVKELNPDFGFDLILDADLPPGCGLSSSAAVGTATAAVVAKAMGLELSQMEIFRLAVRVEREILGWPGGSQDQYAAAIGGFNVIEFDGLEAAGRRLSIPDSLVWELEKNLVLCHTGTAHLSGSIHTDIKAAYSDPDSPCRRAMRELKRIGGLMRDALQGTDLETFAKLMNENWRYHQDLHESCNSPRLEVFYDIVRKNDAPGAKTCGAGGGGCIVVYHPGRKRREMIEELEEAGGMIMDVAFDHDGTVSWPALTNDSNSD